MKKKTKQSAKNNDFLLAVSLGVCAALFLTLIGATVIASMINRGILEANNISFISIGVWFVSSFAGMFLYSKFTKTKSIPAALMIAGIYTFVLLGLKIIMFDAPFAGIGKGIAAILVGVLAGSVLFLKQKSVNKVKIKYSSK